MNSTDHYMREEYITDDNIHSPWFNLDNWITDKAYRKLDAKTKQYYYE